MTQLLKETQKRSLSSQSLGMYRLMSIAMHVCIAGLSHGLT